MCACEGLSAAGNREAQGPRPTVQIASKPSYWRDMSMVWVREGERQRQKICAGGWTGALTLQAYLSRCQQPGFRASSVPKFSCWRECDPYCIYVYILHFLISQRGEQDEAVCTFWICLSTGCFCSDVLWGWHRYVCSCLLYMRMCLCYCWKYMLSLAAGSMWSHGAVVAFLLSGCWI